MLKFKEFIKLKEYSKQGATDDIVLTVQNNNQMKKNRSDFVKPEIRSKYQTFLSKK